MHEILSVGFRFITSAKEVLLSPVSVCLLVIFGFSADPEKGTDYFLSLFNIVKYQSVLLH